MRLTGHDFGDDLDVFWQVSADLAGPRSLVGGDGQVMLPGHAFGDGLDDFLQVSVDWAGPHLLAVLAWVRRWPGSGFRRLFVVGGCPFWLTVY